MNSVAVLQPSATLWAWDSKSAFPFLVSSLRRRKLIVRSRLALTANRGLTNGSTSTSSQSIPAQPSASVLSSIRTLVSAILRLSLHRTQADPSIARSLLAGFEASALPLLQAFLNIVRDLEEGQRREEVALQAAWDALFLRKVCEVGFGEEKSERRLEWEQVVTGFLVLVNRPSYLAERRFANAISLIPQTSSSTALQSTLDSSAFSYLQRTQTLFAALLPSTLSSSSSALATSSSSSASINWLPLGAPALGSSGSEFKSLLGLVKPGPRLGLLPTRG